MDAAVAIARSAARTEYSDIPPEAVAVTKKDILDTLGTAVAGSAAPGGREIVDFVKESGGSEASSILVYGGRAPAENAAMANASMAHALDYDDTHDDARIHAGVTVVPAAFAAAERIGKVHGRDFIAAVTLGIDMVCRMGLANQEGPAGWVLTPLYGYFGAAVAAGKLLGLDEATLVNAMGIAYSQASGNNQCVDDGALTKRLQAGFAARGGVIAALMAQKGVTGAVNSLEGRCGLYKTYHGGDYDPNPLTDGLGKRFEVINLSFKPYPCCRTTNPYIDAALALRREHDIRAEDVTEIIAVVNKPLDSHLLVYPLDVKRNPRTIVDAQFSIPYTVACALIKGRVTIDDFSEAAVRDATVIALANKVMPRFDPKLARRGITPGMLEIKTKGGTYTKFVDVCYGNPRNPMDMRAIVGKFKDCARHAARPLSETNIAKVVELSEKLEELDDVAEVVGLLA
ncbi:MAG: MmgE/PrpD family protein [Chloroflexi bacterium]|nr:MmgE/PrpD family protein [Chloroflexota bacterium]